MAGYDNGNGNGHGEELHGANRQATMREFLAVLFRRKWIVIGLFVATTITVLVMSLVTPALYISSGSVYVKRGEKESLLSPFRRVTGNWEQDLGSEMEIVRSQPVLDRARAILTSETEGEPVTMDLAQIDVEVKGKSTVLAIGYVDRDPRVAEVVCAAVIRAYVEFRQKDFALAYPRQFFESELQQVEDDLKHWDRMRRDFASASGAIEVAEQNRQLIGQLGTLQQRQNTVEADLAAAQAAQESMLELRQNPDIDLPTFTSLFSNETALIELKRKIMDNQARLASLRERYREETFEIENAKRTVATLQEMLRKEVDAHIQMSASRISIVEARRAILARDINRIEADLRGMPEKQSRMALMDREIDVLRQRYNDLTANSDQAKVNEHTSQSVNVLLLSPATPARVQNARDYVRLALAPAFSLVVGIGLAFFMDGLDLTVRTAGHAERAMELPVLASLTDRRRRSAWKGQGSS